MPHCLVCASRSNRSTGTFVVEEPKNLQNTTQIPGHPRDSVAYASLYQTLYIFRMVAFKLTFCEEPFKQPEPKALHHYKASVLP